MGFFSSLLRGVGRVATSFLGITAPAAAAAAPIVRRAAASPIVRRVGRGALALGGAAALGGAFAGGEALAGGGFEGDGTGVSGGNGLTFRRTVVETINRESGDVVRVQVLRGAPFIMRHDIIVAKRVIRMASKLGRTKGLRHTVRQSVASQLTEEIKDQALAQVRSLGGSRNTKDS